MRGAVLNQLIPSTSPTWFDQAEAICDVKALSPHGTSGCISIADTESIRPIDKRGREVHDEYTKAAQALGEEYYPDTPAGPKGPIETFIMRHGPSATQPRAHGVAGFVVGAFGGLPAEYPELLNLAAWV